MEEREMINRVKHRAETEQKQLKLISDAATEFGFVGVPSMPSITSAGQPTDFQRIKLEGDLSTMDLSVIQDTMTNKWQLFVHGREVGNRDLPSPLKPETAHDIL